MSTRKRTRQPSLDPSSDEDELQDELSPRKSDLKATPISNGKKRKLNTYGSVNGSKNGVDEAGGLSTLRKKVGSLVGGLFGLNGSKRDSNGVNTEEEDQEVDELAQDEDSYGKGKGSASKTNGSRRKFQRKKKDIFDLPSSGDDAEVLSVKSANVRRKLATVAKENGESSSTKRGRKGKGNTLEQNVWDVPDSDLEEEETSAKKSGRKSTADSKNSGTTMKIPSKARPIRNGIEEVAPAEMSQNAARKSSRARKPTAKASSPPSVAEPENNSAAEEIGPPRREKGNRKKKSSTPDPEASDDEIIVLPTSSAAKSSRQKKAAYSSPAPQTHPQPQSSVKKRGRPRKNLDGLIQDAKQGTPKGILTPSKGKTLKNKKSVAFEHGQEENDFGWKDIPNTASAKKLKELEVEAQREADNDAACGICSKKNSRRGNQILFCEGCNLAVHQKCYDIREIPDDDWFCKNCANGIPSEHHDDESVASEVEIVEDEAPTPSKPTPTRSLSEQDETFCAICSGLDSKIGNKIILCDGCNFSVHVQCYQLPAFPKGQWFCRTCQAAAGEDPFNLGIDEEEVVEVAQGYLFDIEGFDTHLRRAQRVILDKLTGQRRIKVIGHDEELQKVHQVVEQTIVAGEGNSMLVIGARGCGKSTLVESVISDLSAEHREKFHVVRLNGFIHTDDKIASKEIWRQLGREMELGDDDNSKPSNYADTLASLLALLSHPSEISGENTTTINNQAAKSVVFILDEFDLFTTHSRQTLLYNLFDIAQARKAPIVVLGLTTKVDVVESLEKRVKSRFSHRYVHLSLPRSLPAFWEICKAGLTIDEEEYAAEGDEFVAGQSEFLEYWNSMIENLYTSDSPFKHHIQSHFFRTKSIPTFFTTLLLPLTSLSPTSLPLKSHALHLPQHPQTLLLPPDSKLHLLPSLSELELALLISSCRLDIIHDTDTLNFSMAYDEYSSLTSKHKIQTSSSGVNALGGSAKVWGKEVVIGAWERLGEYGILVPAGIGGGLGGGTGRDGGKAGRMFKVDVGLEEIVGSVEGLSAVMAKWCREI